MHSTIFQSIVHFIFIRRRKPRCTNVPDEVSGFNVCNNTDVVGSTPVNLHSYSCIHRLIYFQDRNQVLLNIRLFPNFDSNMQCFNRRIKLYHIKLINVQFRRRKNSSSYVTSLRNEVLSVAKN